MDWQEELTANIGQQVLAYRGDRSVLWLENRTEQLGLKVGRGAISRLENGKRGSITVAELLVLAAALDVPPALLLFPQYPDGVREVVPEVFARGVDASEWLAGRQELLADKGEIGHFPYPLVAAAIEREGALVESFKVFQETGDFFESDNFLRKLLDDTEKRIKALGGTVAERDGDKEG